MKSKKTIWTTIMGGVTSAAPILLSCCKSGACVGVCASPIASLFGISSATLASSRVMQVVEPVLIAASAVSFTVSYYSIYVLPKSASCGSGDCACEPSSREKRRDSINKFVFWFGLILSIGFLSYFEIQKYNSNVEANSECGTSCAPGECGEDINVAGYDQSDSSSCCQGNSSSCEK